MFKVYATSAFMLFFLSGVSHAKPPKYDVKDHCKSVASFTGEYSETLYSSCIQMEQSAYNNLKSKWDKLPSKMRGHCNGIATFTGPGSYNLLESCVKMEVEAAQKNSSTEFEY